MPGKPRWDLFRKRERYIMNVLREPIYIHSYLLPLNQVIDRKLNNPRLNLDFPHLCNSNYHGHVKE
jgi:hypothetical protein